MKDIIFGILKVIAAAFIAAVIYCTITALLLKALVLMIFGVAEAMQTP